MVVGGSARTTTVPGDRDRSLVCGWVIRASARHGHTSSSSSVRTLTLRPDAKSSKATKHPNRCAVTRGMHVSQGGRVVAKPAGQTMINKAPKQGAVENPSRRRLTMPTRHGQLHISLGIEGPGVDVAGVERGGVADSQAPGAVDRNG